MPDDLDFAGKAMSLPRSLQNEPLDGLLADDQIFSLVLGGPLYQLYLRTKLTRRPLDLLLRRVVGISLFCWLPLLLLSLFSRHIMGGVAVPFLYDVDVHTRFLAAVPLLIAAEVVVHGRIRPIVRQFIDRGIITQSDRAKFEAIINSTISLRNSVLIEVLILVFVYTVGHWVWREHFALGISTWYAFTVSGGTRLTPAGYWYAFVSLPLLRFILYRWYFRLFLWYRFLWQIRGLNLQLNLFHPDRSGGLGFLAGSVFAFSPLLLAHTVFLAGFIGDRIWHTTATLPDFKMEIVGAILFLVVLVSAPLSFFLNRLTVGRRVALRDFGCLSSRYVDDFRHKWIEEPPSGAEPLLGTSDIQSLADLGNSYTTVTEMRLLPMGKETIVRLVILLIVPLLPLTLTMIPLDQIVDRLLRLAL